MHGLVRPISYYCYGMPPYYIHRNISALSMVSFWHIIPVSYVTPYET